jgi:mannose-6-phosphate isomerase
MPEPTPLRFVSQLLPKVWGGDRLRRYGKPVEIGSRIGESWVLADLPATSPSGGGGEARQSVVLDGPYAGQTIGRVLGELGTRFLGNTKLADDGTFPLLVKLLDARENLSVQVHPSPAYARAHAGAHLKTESWLVLEAEPGAKIYAGLRDGVTLDALARSIGEGSVPSLLRQIDARAGMLVHLPSGLVHALGAGVLVAEVQTASDTTFRIFDWGRTERPLHIEQALECVGENSTLQAEIHDLQSGVFCTPHYSLGVIRVRPGETMEIPEHRLCRGCLVIDGDGQMSMPGWEACVSKGDTTLQPAHRSATICAGADGVQILVVCVGEDTV